MALKHDELDTLIDDVARRMTAGDSGAAFTSSVVARLDERQPIWRSPWLLSPIAAAALIVVAVALWRGARPVDRGPERPALQATGPVARPVQGRDQLSTVLLKPDTTGLVARAFQASDPIPSSIDALAPPPIAVARIVDIPLAAVDSIRADPLETITPITITPLDNGDGLQRRFE